MQRPEKKKLYAFLPRKTVKPKTNYTTFDITILKYDMHEGKYL